MNYKFLGLIFLSLFVSIITAQTPKGSISGEIIDLESKQPLIGANIFIKNLNRGTTSDADGKFSIKNLEVGNYTITISYIGYNPVSITDVIIKPERITFLPVEMKSSEFEMNEVVVTGGYFSEVETKPLSAIKFSSEEIRRAPGSGGDVSRILYGLPSVAKVNDQTNSLIVRGGSPLENSFYIDNIEIPNINHFPSPGSSGGPIGILNVDFIKDVEFHSGGFSGNFGNRMSSVMEISFREGNKEKYDSQVGLSLQGFGGTIEGPFANGKGTFMAAANKSYLDLVFNAIDEGSPIPRYYDAQAKVTYDISPDDKISVIDIYSNDKIERTYENAVKEKENMYQNVKIQTNTVGINVLSSWKNGYSNTSISHIYNNADFSFGETKSKQMLVDSKMTEHTIQLRKVVYLKLAESHKVEFGLETKFAINKYDTDYFELQNYRGEITPAMKVDKNFKSNLSSIFATYILTPFNNFQITASLRGDYFNYNDKTTFAPRISAKYDLSENTYLTGFWGVFYQNLPSIILAQSEQFKDLRTPQSYNIILGIHHMLNESTKLSIEAFNKKYSFMPVDPAQPEVFVFDQEAQTGILLNHAKLTDAGEAQSYGVEFILQKKLASDIYGLVSASYSRSRYNDFNTWRDRAYDNKFNITLEGGYKPDNEWEFSARWIYAGGTPTTPFDMVKSAAANKGIYDLKQMNGSRLPDYHSLNIRVDRRFNFMSTNLIVYLSIWNTYGRENVSSIYWNEIKNSPEKMKQWGTLPILGVEFEF